MASELSVGSSKIEAHVAGEWTLQALEATESVTGAAYPDVEVIRKTLERLEIQIKDSTPGEQGRDDFCTP